MDPKEILRLADQAISDGLYDDASTYLGFYREWRKRGGFEPIEVAGSLMCGDAFAQWSQDRLNSYIAQQTEF